MKEEEEGKTVYKERKKEKHLNTREIVRWEGKGTKDGINNETRDEIN